MCLGIPGLIVEMSDDTHDLAKVDIGGVQRVINIRLLANTGLKVGDWVLVHVGFALAHIDEAEAEATLEQLRKMSEEYDTEMEAFDSSEIV